MPDAKHVLQPHTHDHKSHDMRECAPLELAAMHNAICCGCCDRRHYPPAHNGDVPHSVFSDGAVLAADVSLA